MKAMIFAAGLGTRLKPFTLEHPKALVPVAGVPMLERVIKKLQALGISEFVVNVHHFAQQIVDFLAANDNFGAKIAISDETAELLDTGGGILTARQWLDCGNEPFIVHNADILTDADIPAMEALHMASGAVATLLVAKRATQRYLLFDPSSMMMRGWTNIATGECRPADLDPAGLVPAAFGGIHILSPAIFPMLEAYATAEDKRAFGITPFYINTCTHAPIQGFIEPRPYSWYDVGKPETLIAAEAAILGK